MVDFAFRFTVRGLMILSLVLLISALVACESIPPEPFVIGDVVSPPYGCLEARKRGVDC